MRKISVRITIALAALLAGCGILTPRAESALEQGTAAIVCALEFEELADPTLDKICQDILAKATTEQRAAALAHLEAAKTRRLSRPIADAGTDR